MSATGSQMPPLPKIQDIDDEPDLDVLDAKEAAKLLRIGHNQLYNAAGRGEVPFRRIGKTMRFSRRGLLEWLASPSREE